MAAASLDNSEILKNHIVERILDKENLPELVANIILDENSIFTSIDFESSPLNLIPQLEFRLKQSRNNKVKISGGENLLYFVKNLPANSLVKEFFIKRGKFLIYIVYSNSPTSLEYMFVEPFHPPKFDT